MNKVIREILILLWRVLKTFVWKWLKPRMRKIVFFAVAVIALLGVLTMVIASSC